MGDAPLWAAGQLLVGGPASGDLVALAEPISFWGGVDENTGRIIDPHHSQRGTELADVALLTGVSRGSSSSASTLLECVRRRTAPSMLLLDPDPILIIGAAAAWELYGRGPSVVLLAERPTRAGALHLTLNSDGRLYAGGGW
ncbi:aconitase X swivel domain-containing protein [Amycolatopsis jejuensis]|uniref:aconitase X swivel domain-containing protein n=1 Tax=Amycolatopsis jejuensis TaxID=330084 RepID=UPI0006918818|nr:DUF126 domain-containing protein [Amycolatopsis jejuensis]